MTKLPNTHLTPLDTVEHLQKRTPFRLINGFVVFELDTDSSPVVTEDVKRLEAELEESCRDLDFT